MSILSNTLRTALRRIGYLVIACGLPLTTVVYAQSSSSSYNPQYGNSPYYNPTYNNQKTPHYTGKSWLDHWEFEGGGGVTPAAGSTQNYANVGWNILLGGGYKFNNRLSLLAEWNFNRMTVPHGLAYVISGVPDGNEHIWTVDVNPKFNVIHRERWNGYLIGGGGFSRALTSFTVPVVFACFDYYFGPYPCSGSITVAQTSTNQGNIDIGGGAEWRLSAYDRGQLFVESRYLKLFSPNSGLPPGDGAALVPVTFGYRW